jgi:hypothetical protein
MSEEQKPATPGEEKFPTPRALFVVIGAAEADGDALLWSIAPISEDQAHGRAPLDVDALPRQYYAAKSKKHFGSPGGIYSIETPKPGTIIPASARFVTMIPSEDVRVRLSSVSRSLERELAARKALRKREKSDPLREALEPVRIAYAAAKGARRAHLLAEIVEYVTRGTK